MAYVLLGFLCLRTLTQYEMLKALKTRVSPFYQPSLGSIQATLKKLLNNGYITIEEIREGRKRNTYHITRAGREAFFQWMRADAYKESVTKLDNELSTRLFFLGLLEPFERKQVVKTAIGTVEGMLAEYSEADKVYSRTSYSPAAEDVARYQLKTLSMGIQKLKSILDWLRQLYCEMEES